MRRNSRKLLNGISQGMYRESLQRTALIMALHCVRNTVIENYHAAGKLSQSDMKIFNKEVSDKIYSMLQIMLNPQYSDLRIELFTAHSWQLTPFNPPSGWDKPKFDKDFLHLMRITRNRLRKKYSL